MVEAYLFYSSLTLLAMGCVTLGLSIFFRLKFHAVSSVPKSLSASVFSKTFNVFNPYPERRKVIHNFLVALPLLVFFASLGFILSVWKLFEYGLMLSFFILIVSLNLMLFEVAEEIIQNTKIFINAVRCGASFGVGDLKVFQAVRKTLPRLSNYYLGLTIFFVVFAVILSYVWYSVLWFFARFIGFIVEASAVAGPVGWQVAGFLFTLTVVIIQILVWKIKGNLLSYLIELPAAED